MSNNSECIKNNYIGYGYIFEFDSHPTKLEIREIKLVVYNDPKLTVKYPDCVQVIFYRRDLEIFNTIPIFLPPSEEYFDRFLND